MAAKKFECNILVNGTIAKVGGSSAQFLKADGSTDSNTYATTASLGNYLPLSGGTMSNTNVVINLNADLLDGKEYSFIKNKIESRFYWGGVNRISESTLPLDPLLSGRVMSFDKTNGGNSFSVGAGFVLTLSASDTNSEDSHLANWGGAVSQFVFTEGQSKFFMRTGQNGSALGTLWNPFVEIYTTGNLTNLNQLTTRNFSDLQNKPTTLSGYGITDALSSSSSHYVGTTLIANNRASAVQTLTGVNINGSIDRQSNTTISDLNIVSTDNGVLRFDAFSDSATNKPEGALNNANGVISMFTNHGTQYGKQIAFQDSENLYIRKLSAGTYGSWRKLWHSGNLTNLNQLTNGPGYVTGNGTGASGTWGISISGDASTVGGIASNRIIYGNNGSGSNGAATTYNTYELSQYKSGFWDVNGAAWTPNTDWWWGITTAHQSNSSSYNYSGQQIYNLAGTESYFRSVANGTPNTWRRILHDGNYNSYSPTLTGTGASGTWGISISGNAATATSALSLTINNEGAVVDLNTIPLGRTPNYGSPNYWTNKPASFSTYGTVYNLGGTASAGSLGLQLLASVNHNDSASTRDLYFRTSNNLGFQNDWKTLWHSGNLTNLNQLTNGPGYVIPSGNVATSDKLNVWDNRDVDRAPGYYTGHMLQPFFNQLLPNMGGNWGSGINVAGWDTGSYQSWQLYGGSHNSTTNEWYLRSGLTSWGTSYKIWHSGNLTAITQLTPAGSNGAFQYNNNGVMAGQGNNGTYDIDLGKPLVLEPSSLHPNAQVEGTLFSGIYQDGRPRVKHYGGGIAPVDGNSSQTLTSGTPNLFWDYGSNAYLYLNANTTLYIYNVPDGASGTIAIQRDATNTKTLTVYSGQGFTVVTIGVNPGIVTVASKWTTLTYKRIGSTLLLVYGWQS